MKKYRRQSFIPRSTSSEATAARDEEEWERGNSGAIYADLSLRKWVRGHTTPYISLMFYWQHVEAFNPQS